MKAGQKAILHVDGDAFFATCELTRNPGLRGKPVVTGRERGIVSAATYEAKRLGIRRAMPIFMVRKMFPQVIVLAGDYDLYGMYAKRLYAIVRRYARRVEEYGIDECFGDLTGQDEVLGMSYPEIVRRIQDDLRVELALSFSLGLGPTKALAKLGSKYRKPGGLAIVGEYGEGSVDITELLSGTKIGDVWGIGHALSVQLEAQHVRTAHDFVTRPGPWVAEKFARPTWELWKELRGEGLWGLSHGAPAAPHSIQRTRTFTPPATDPKLLWSHLSANVEEACRSARAEGLIPARASFFLKSQGFQYRGDEVRLPYPSDIPTDVLAALRKPFLKAYARDERYRATGVTLFAFRAEGDLQLDFWGANDERERKSAVFEALDRLAEEYGEPVVELGSSFMAREARKARRIPAEGAYADQFRVPGTGRKHLPLPVLGSV
jgi:DNA polymerase-4/DNA polymerase V